MTRCIVMTPTDFLFFFIDSNFKMSDISINYLISLKLLRDLTKISLVYLISKCFIGMIRR
ncbi:hypothetical protein VHTUMSATKI_28910 [Vibrio harveyi]